MDVHSPLHSAAQGLGFGLEPPKVEGPKVWNMMSIHVNVPLHIPGRLIGLHPYHLGIPTPDIPSHSHSHSHPIIILILEEPPPRRHPRAFPQNALMVLLNGFIFEHGAIAGLPLLSAENAELGVAAAGHVIASFVVLDHGFAVVALLPALLLGDLLEGERGRVLGTFAASVEFGAAGNADAGATFRTLAVSPFGSLVTPGRGKGVDVLVPDELAAALSGAVDFVLGGSLFVLEVPLLFERVGEEFFHCRGWFDGEVGLAAFRWHGCRVGNGQFKHPFDAIVAHVVFAVEGDCLGDGAVSPTGDAFNLWFRGGWGTAKEGGYGVRA